MSQRIRHPLRILGLQAWFLGNAFKWNLLHPIILPPLVLRFSPPGLKNSLLGLLTFGGLLLAAFWQPLAGHLSDQTGDRRRYLLLGGLLEPLFLLLLGLAGLQSRPILGLSAVLAGYVGLQFVSNLAQGPAQGLVPEQVAADRLGLASGLKNLLDMLGLAGAALLGGRLLGEQAEGLSLTLGLLVAGSLLTLGITLKSGNWANGRAAARRPGLVAAWKQTFRLDADLRGPYRAVILQRFVFLLGLYGLQAFLQYYLRDVLQVAEPVRQTGMLLAVLALALTVVAVLGGWLADRVSPSRLMLGAASLAALSYGLAMLAPTFPTFMAAGALLGMASGLFLSVNWAQANRLAPVEAAGRYLGLTNLATAGAAALSRLEGPLIDGLNALWPQTLAGYRLLFVVGIGGALLAAWLQNRLPGRYNKPTFNPQGEA